MAFVLENRSLWDEQYPPKCGEPILLVPEVTERV